MRSAIRQLILVNLVLLSWAAAGSAIFAWTHGRAVAQSVLTSLWVNSTNPSIGNTGDMASVRFDCNSDGTTVAPGGFNNDDCLDFNHTVTNGQYLYNGTVGDNAKRNNVGMSVQNNYYSAGQHSGSSYTQNCFGIGDCQELQWNLSYYGGSSNGDEGIGFADQSYVHQAACDGGAACNAPIAHLTSSVTRTTCNTTITQAVTANINVQTVTVASTTGCNVNDWIVIDQEVATAGAKMEALQITAVGSGTITGKFWGNHLINATITPAMLFGVDSEVGIGQGRILVNTSSASTYSTGTISSISGANFTGSSTVWTNSIVGGTATNIGCISLAADDLVQATNLKSWYPIIAVNSNTNLAIGSFNPAGANQYNGYGPGAGTYIIRPCIKILYIPDNHHFVTETSSTTWNNGDTIEGTLTPDAAVNGFQLNLSHFTGVSQNNLGAMLNISNRGARTFTGGVNIFQNMAYFGTITAGGSGYTNGTYGNVPLTGGHGVAMTADIVVSGGVVTSVTRMRGGSTAQSTSFANGYVSGDVLSASNANLGGAGSGFQFTLNGSDGPWAWTYGINMSDFSAHTGFVVGQTDQQAILLRCGGIGSICGNSGTTGDHSGRISWGTGVNSQQQEGGAYIQPHSANEGMDIQWNQTAAGAGDQEGMMSFINHAVVGTGTVGEFYHNGFMRLKPVTFASLPTCAAGLEGSYAAVTDATVTSFAYDQPITSGSGTHHILAYCNGSGWVAH